MRKIAFIEEKNDLTELLRTIRQFLIHNGMNESCANEGTKIEDNFIILNFKCSNSKFTQAIGVSLSMLGWDYGDDIPDLSTYDKVIMCDVSFPEKEMINLTHKFGNNFVWIDHHVSAINTMTSFKEEGRCFINGLRDTKFAACELTWKCFFPNEEMPEIVRLLGRYDCFGHKGTTEEQTILEFQYAARAAIANIDQAYNFLRDHERFGEQNVDNFKTVGKGIYRYLRTEAKHIYKKAFPIKLIEPIDEDNKALRFIVAITDMPLQRKFLCVNQERFNPINFGIDYHKEGYAGFACFWYKDGKWMFSLYNDNGVLDCSAIAKQYGGGGHRGAAGFVCDDETLLKIIRY